MHYKGLTKINEIRDADEKRSELYCRYNERAPESATKEFVIFIKPCEAVQRLLLLGVSTFCRQ